MIQCTQCKKTLDGPPAASISGGVMGDEYIESWYLCAPCKVYTVEIYHDRFCNDPSILISGPVEKEDGDAKVALIRNCSRAWDKHCRCQSHMTYFNGNLD